MEHKNKRISNLQKLDENTDFEIQIHCTKKEYICDNCDMIFYEDDKFETHMLGRCQNPKFES